MSQSFGGWSVTPLQVPDFGATLARAQNMQANRLAMLAQRRQLDQQQALQDFFANNGAGFASSDPAKRMNLLAMLAGQPGGATMALPMLTQERENNMIAGALRGEMPGAASPAPQAAAPAGGGDYLTRLVADESGGRPDARNPRSSATGLGQFIDGTWLQFAEANPDLFRGMSREQILAARTNPDLSRRAIEWYRQQNASALQAAGLPANDGTVALAHRFGPQGAAALLRADPNAPVGSVVGEQVMAANPDLAGRTVGQVVQRYGQRFGGGYATAAGGPQGNQYARQIAALVATGNPRALQIAQALSQIGARETPRMTEVRTNEGVFLVDPTNPERRVRVGGIPETAPRTPERFEQDRALAEAGAARSQTTVNAGDRRTDVLVADAWNEAEQTARDAGRRNVLLRRAEAAFERFQPGMLAERRIWLGQLARELGIRSPGTSEGEVLQQVQRNLELAATPRGQGQITENERALIREAVPVLLRTPEGARAAINLIRQLDDYEMQIARIYRENARRHGGQPDAVSVREDIANFVTQNQPPDVQAVLEPLMNQQPGQAGGVNAEPPPSVPPPPRIGEVRDGYRYRGGNPGDQSSWERVR